MLDKFKDECGVFGIFDRDGLDAPLLSYFGLYAIQHRGQESAGIAVSNGKEIIFHKGMGLVPEVFNEENINRLKDGGIAIGHVRHSMKGGNLPQNTQPLVTKYKKGNMALAHNGALINSYDIRQELEEQGAIFQTTTDTEVMANIIARSSSQGLEKALEAMMGIIHGAYALAIMTEDKLIGIRDPHGIRPLALGKIKNSYVIASETCAFDVIGAEYIRDIRPGEIVVITKEGLTSIQTPMPLQSSFCIFEFIYFARTDSVIDGISVHTSRREAGRILARENPIDADIVIGVPDSGTTAALGYAEESGISYREGLIKNRYVGRTFIKPTQAIREQDIRIKLNALRRIVRGKRIVMVDDSIVRGTTSKAIVDMLRLAGAREIHMRVSSPMIKYPCHFGIDTPDREDLIGAAHTEEEICEILGVDSLKYLTIDGLLKTVESSGCSFCLGCFNGEYPMKCEGGCQ